MAQDLVITEKDRASIDDALDTFIRDSGSRCAVLVDKRGFIMAKKGDFTNIDTTTLAVLATSSFSSAQALAKIIGEENFFSVYHQGKMNSIRISAMCNWASLVAVHDVSVTETAMRLSAKEASKKIEPVIFEIVERYRSSK
jgi:predicted regulator of Ras-like GTPase activity (Roadblock/LC7/MglB family)